MRNGELPSMPIIVPNSISDIVYQKIKSRIVCGKLRLGQKITDTEFVEEFKVSKTPIREALLKLKNEGLIEIVPRSGTFVFKFSERDLRALCDTRLIFEEGALRKSHRDNNVKLINELSQNLNCQKQLLENNSTADYLKKDREFHNIFFALADNPYLQQAHALIFDKINVLRAYLNLTDDFIVRSVGAHAALVEYIAMDDIDNACLRLKQHIQGTFNDKFLAYLNSIQE